MTFNSEFRRIFGETFQSEDFQYCSKLNVFVKMLNEDLMAFFGVKSAPAWNKGAKGFFLTAGIISAYGVIESIVYPRDKVYSDKKLYNEALKEAERRKNENIKKLYSYKLSR